MSPRKRKYTRRKKGFFSSLKNTKNYDIDLSPETTREILGFTFIGAGLVFLLFSFGFAGNFGIVIYNIFQTLIGISCILLPFIFLFLGISFVKPEKFQIKPSTIIGISLFIASFSSLFHLLFSLNASLDEIGIGFGGGYLGFGISTVLNQMFGFWASLIVLLGFLIVSILLTLDTTTAKIIEKIKDFFESKKEESRVVVNSEEEFKPKTKPILSFRKSEVSDEKTPEFEKTPVVSSYDSEWKLPPTDLLSDVTSKPESGNINENVKIIKQTLSNFGIDVEMVDVNVGPTVTQYTLKPAVGVKLNKITNLNNDLALALAAHPIRIEAPIPGKSLVGMEVPNKSVSIVRLRKLLENEQFQNKRKSNLTIVLGKDVSGGPAYANLDNMPHLLIAGSTGSGKSVCINTIITSLLYQNSPRDLKMIMIDPKQVELTTYSGIPHLLSPVITQSDKSVNALAWVVEEMEKRYALLSQHSKKDINSYNASFKKEKIPYIVIVIDELAELMMTTASEVETSIVRIAQKARATGIHLIVATQRPEANVVTGLIKANIPVKIAFAVSNAVNSRIIIDSTGAEKLLGNGDMLYQASDVSKPRRIQGALVEELEINKVIDFVKNQEEVNYDDEVVEKKKGSSFLGVGSDEDPLVRDAIEEVVNAGKASASLLQRRLKVGYARAARLLDILEEKNIIGPQEGSKPRDVYIEDIDNLFQDDNPEEINNDDKKYEEEEY